MTSRSLRRVVRRNRATLAIALVAALAASGTTVAASYLVLSTTNTATATTTLKSAVNGKVLQIANTNSTGGTSVRGIGITVPAGRPPIVVNSSAGKATNLNADKLDGINSTGFIRGPVSAWREIGSTGNPAFAGAWVNHGAPFNTAAFFKDPLGIVRLKGVVDYTSSVAFACDAMLIFTLPQGYRPAALTLAPTIAIDVPARVNIWPTGDVRICWPTSFSPGQWISLDGITFRAAQ